MLDEHPQRRAVVAEMHLRRWPRIVAPCRVVQFVRLVAEDQRAAESDALARLMPAARAGEPRHREGSLGPGMDLAWERHSEASTLTLFLADNAQPDLVECALDRAGRMPGQVVRATRLVVLPTEAEARAALPGCGFAEDELVTCHLCPEGEGAARIWSDFRLRDDGFGLILVAAGGLAPLSLARVLQRLQELGNYRNLALLGLPVARAGWGELDRIEGELDAINLALTRPDITDDALMARVADLWRELIAQVSAAHYRISATEAYAAIVEERLADLRIRPCPGYLSLADFTQRRFLPAVRTCTAHRRRAALLAERTSQVVALLRTRIETRIENQNARLLASMESSAQRQLRLQQLVEGLSVVPISYYALAILSKLLEGLEPAFPQLRPGLWMPLVVPAVVLAAWLAIGRQKRRILGH